MTARRRGSRLSGAAWTASVVALTVVGLAGIWGGLQGSSEPSSPGPDQWGEVEDAATEAPGATVLPPSLPSPPARLDVPAVGIHTSLLRLGLNEDETLEVPSRPMLAGWYTGSPTPGEQGPSIIAGHVDSVSGPAVFYRLGEVVRGDQIDVTRKDGSVASFHVTAVRSFAKRDFPTRTVYGNVAQASLRLITCANWNDTTREYDGNIVVFATMVAGP